MNSQCECPVGQGPHATCKHVVAAALVLQDYPQSGKLKIKESCTETLQSFHRPSNPFVGPQITTEQMGHGLGQYDEDPRKNCHKNDPNMMSRIMMATVSFCNATGYDLAIRHAFPKADIQVAASHDHLYDTRPMTEF